MKQFQVKGMSCAACAMRVEKAVSKVPGVTGCSVSLLTNSMGIEGEVSDKKIIAAVESAGYHAKSREDVKQEVFGEAEAEDDFEDKETKALFMRLIVSACFLLALMYFSMGHTMFRFPLPDLFERNALATGIAELILSAVVLVINQRFFISGFKSALHLAPNMDTLVALGSFVSFVYSAVMLFLMTFAQLNEGIAAADRYTDNLYFESAAMILVFISVGKMLEARSKGKTTDALKSLMKLAPKTAVVVHDKEEITVPIDKVRVGDIFVVKPGNSIPVDGIIVVGKSAVNESALTGESVPVDKAEGDEVSAATINQSGYLECRAVRVGKDTTLSQIIEMVSDAAATKAPIAKIADKAAGIFVPCVLAAALITFLVWIVVCKDVGTALTFATSVLVISCPCSLGLATPVAIMVGNGIGAKNGILFKTAAALEGTGRIQIAALDKTGTLTEGEMQVTDICPLSDVEEKELIQIAYALEAKSEHPVAKAIVYRAECEGISQAETTDFEVIPGKGIRAKLRDIYVYGGNAAFIEEYAVIPSEMKERSVAFSKEGKTPLFFAKEDRLLGTIAVADVIKEDAKEAVLELKKMGISVVMITGDNEQTAKAIAGQAGVDMVVSGVLPGGKEEVVNKLKAIGRVAMVGDGINDAPALTRADIGIAVSSGTDVAVEAADVVLMNNRLRNVPASIRLGRVSLRNIRQNLFWAFFYNSVGIPVAAGIFAASLGLKLNPMIGALAMSLSSFCVVTNALRLNRVNIFDGRKDRNTNNNINSEIASVMFAQAQVNQTDKGENEMKKTITITGMMCPHCEARVKSVLEGIEGVDEAIVSHESGTAVVKLSMDISEDILREVIEKEKYEVVGIE